MFKCPRWSDLTDNRLVLLNKYNVLEQHLLIVSREFEDQRTALTAEDFQALAVAMAGFPALGFYNSGEEAGASQRHRHLQVLPLQPGQGKPPLNAGILHNTATDYTYHLISSLSGDHRVRARQLHEFYQEGLIRLELRSGDRPQLKPYNLLVGDNEALMVPRRRAEVCGVSINSLGYAGMFLFKNHAQRKRLTAYGLMNALTAAGVPRQS